MKRPLFYLLPLLLIAIASGLSSCLVCSEPLFEQRTDSAAWGTPVKLLWKVPLLISDHNTGQNYTTPIVIDNKIIIGYCNKIDCIDKDNGEVYWSVEIAPRRGGSIEWPSQEFILEGNRLYVVGAHTGIACVDVTEGRLIWKRNLKGPLEKDFSTFSQSATAIYVTTNIDQQCFAISKADGTILWQVNSLPEEGRFKGSRTACPTYYNGTVLIPFRAFMMGRASEQGGFTVLNAETGTKIKEFILPQDTIHDIVPWAFLNTTSDYGIIPYNNSFILTSRGTIVRLSPEGNILWRTSLSIEEYFAASVVYHDGVLYGQKNGFAFAVNPENGALLWKTKMPHEYHSSWFKPFLVGNSMYVRTDESWLYRFNTATGTMEAEIDMNPHHTLINEQLYWNSRLYAEGKRIYTITNGYFFCHELQIP